MKLTILATNSVLNGSSVHDSSVCGSQMAISRSNLQATCSAFSLRRRSRRSSRVSTLVGGGVSFGSCKKRIILTFNQYFFHNIHTPQINRGSFPLQCIRGTSFRVAIYRPAVETAGDRVGQTMPEDWGASIESFCLV